MASSSAWPSASYFSGQAQRLQVISYAILLYASCVTSSPEAEWCQIAFLCVFLLAAQLKVATATQAQNLTALHTEFAPVWVPEPESEGT